MKPITVTGVRRAIPREPNAQVQANQKLVVALVQADEEVESAKLEVDAARAREAELRDIAQLRERLIGIVGHDLRNPLNAIVMAASLLGSSGLGEKENRLASSIAASGHRMRRIIDQLLDFTRVRLGGGFPLIPAPANLGLIAKTIANELRLATSANIAVVEHGDLLGVWDSDRLGDVISNLVSNAIDHATPGTPIVVDVRGEGDALTCSVSNEGPAIAPEILPELFMPFRQVDPNAHRANGNLGLGLYIASEIAQSHGGKLAAHSELGKTTFTLTLPRIAPSRP